MTRLLEEAIEHLQKLSEDEQDAAADALFAYISTDPRPHLLQPHQAEEVRRIRRHLASGATRLATDHEVAQAKKRANI
jgi:hypothetical protein